MQILRRSLHRERDLVLHRLEADVVEKHSLPSVFIILRFRAVQFDQERRECIGVGDLWFLRLLCFLKSDRGIIAMAFEA